MTIRETLRKVAKESIEKGITLTEIIEILREENRSLKNEEKIYPEDEMEFRRKLKNFLISMKTIKEPGLGSKKVPLPIFHTDFREKQSTEIMATIYLCETREEAEVLAKERIGVSPATFRRYVADIAYSLKAYFNENKMQYNPEILNYDLIKEEMEKIKNS